MTGYRMSREKDVVSELKEGFVWQVIERMGLGRQRRLCFGGGLSGEGDNGFRLWETAPAFLPA